MAIGLFAASFMLLTGSTEFFLSVAARALQPVFGRIEAARPALMIVPVGAGLALVLRRLIPDMGRCRLAQALIVCSTVLLIVRAFAGARMNSPANVLHLSTFELLISGLLLSALQLHARYVIHVNPNPPLTAVRKVPVLSTRFEIAGNSTKVMGSIESVGKDTETTVSRDQDVVSRKALVNQIESIAGLNSTDLPTPLADSEEKSAEAETGSTSHSGLQGKGKSNKKQKLRKAG